LREFPRRLESVTFPGVYETVHVCPTAQFPVPPIPESVSWMTLSLRLDADATTGVPQSLPEHPTVNPVIPDAGRRGVLRLIPNVTSITFASMEAVERGILSNAPMSGALPLWL
jgi:hypothetical protein